MRHVDAQFGQEFNQLVEQMSEWSGWLASIVSNENGELIDDDGASKGIGNNVDLQLLLALRSKSDVIFTTGKTARAEKYKKSRFAPIAILTRSKHTLDELNVVAKPGAHGTILLTPPIDQDPFDWSNSELGIKGLSSVLFEGGSTSLESLWTSGLPVQLVFSIANSQHPENLDVANVLSKALPWLKDGLLADDLVFGPNRITRWVKSPN